MPMQGTARSPGDFSVEFLRAETAGEWDSFCREVGASYGCYSAWAGLLPRLGFMPIFLCARDGAGQLAGVLPAAIACSAGRRFGVSTWADGRVYGGPLGRDQTAHLALLQAFEEHCVKARASHIRITPVPWLPSDGIQDVLVSLHYRPQVEDVDRRPVAFVLDTRRDFDDVFGALSSGLRWQYRKALRDGLECKAGRGNLPADDYFRLKQQVWRRKGNMCPRRREFDEIYSLPDDLVRWWSAWHEGALVAALYCYASGSSFALKGSVSDSRFSKLNANLVLYLESIKGACSEGRSFYDFGSTAPPGTSHYAWKEKFRGVPHPISSYEKPLRPLAAGVRRAAHRVGYRSLRQPSYGWLGRIDALSAWFEE